MFSAQAFINSVANMTRLLLFSVLLLTPPSRACRRQTVCSRCRCIESVEFIIVPAVLVALRTFRRSDTEVAARDRTLSREGSGAVAHGMVRDELFLLWENTVRERELSVPNPTSALEGALTIRCDFRKSTTS